MADSFIGCSGDLSTFAPRYVDSRLFTSRANHISLKVFLPFFLIILPVFLVPEKPQEFASICERHNPEVVCRVW